MESITEIIKEALSKKPLRGGFCIDLTGRNVMELVEGLDLARKTHPEILFESVLTEDPLNKICNIQIRYSPKVQDSQEIEEFFRELRSFYKCFREAMAKDSMRGGFSMDVRVSNAKDLAESIDLMKESHPELFIESIFDERGPGFAILSVRYSPAVKDKSKL